jgi:ATP phosphoribosyltransferase
MQEFDYCDAIVESGRTIEDNGLEIVKVICDTIYGALYTL